MLPGKIGSQANSEGDTMNRREAFKASIAAIVCGALPHKPKQMTEAMIKIGQPYWLVTFDDGSTERWPESLNVMEVDRLARGLTVEHGWFFDAGGSVIAERVSGRGRAEQA